MSIDIVPINGKSQYFDYNVFETSLKNIIGKRCSDAKIFLFNNFPISVSSETDIDLIIVIAISNTKGNFYIPKSKDGRPIYFHNQIIPVKFITNLTKDKITIENTNQIICNDYLIDYSSEINSIKFNITSYFHKKCDFKKEDLFINPLFFIENKDHFILDNFIISDVFNFNSIHDFFSRNHSNIFVSYRDWQSEIGYKNIEIDIEKIVNQASEDSKIGYITKKKIDRIGRQISNSRVIFDQINKNIIIISGKAGTGKSTELLLLTMKCISDGKNTLYLTYNKLLIFDISKTINSYVNSRLKNSDENFVDIGVSSVLTLHSLFYRLSKKLGVLHILSAGRMEELLNTLRYRMRIIYDFVNALYTDKIIDLEFYKTKIQNHQTFDIGTKEVGIDFVNFIKKRGISIEKLNTISIEFYNHKKRILSNISTNEVFLSDYYGVLKETLLLIESPNKFYEEYNIRIKHELLHSIIDNEKYILEENGEKTITKSGFIEFRNRKVGGFRGKRTLFIDEAQDCHRLEKEILISIYGSDNIVIANGGKEQLIRHVELCDWEIFKSKKLNIKKHYTRSKSYRTKKTVVDFCNFVSRKFGISLNLEPLESEDEGELIFDFRKNVNDYEITEVFTKLNNKGLINGCSAYESLMVLLESNSQKREKIYTETAIVNEFGNIEDKSTSKRGTWKYLNTLEKKDFMFWDGTVESKSQLMIPYSNESRVIYYESCRGLEAWSVACFSLDKFFDQKREDPDAEKYLIEDLLLNQDNEQRKSMFAATWVIMALTRVIDTLYIQVNNRDSEFGRIIDEYIKQDNKNVRELTS